MNVAPFVVMLAGRSCPIARHALDAQDSATAAAGCGPAGIGVSCPEPFTCATQTMVISVMTTASQPLEP